MSAKTVHVGVIRRSWRAAVSVGAVATLLVAGFYTGVRAQDDEPARVVFVARADNPVDALAASAVAAQVGGVVLLSSGAALSADARDGLEAFGADLVVLAGGAGALSTQVEADVAALGYPVRRVAGATRLATARELAALVDELDRAYLPVGGTASRAADADTLAGRAPADLGRVAHTIDDAVVAGSGIAPDEPLLTADIAAPTDGFVIVRTVLSLANVSNAARAALSCQPLVTLGQGDPLLPAADAALVDLGPATAGSCVAEHVFAVPAGDHLAYVMVHADTDIRVHRRSLTVQFVPFDGTGAPPVLPAG